MTTQHFPALGFNPAPGDLGSVDAVTGKLDSAKRSLDSAHAVLSRIGKGGGEWEGNAAKAFAEKVGDLPKYVNDSRDAMRDAVTQLHSWHTALSSYQTKGRQYESEAAAAKRTVTTRETEKEHAVKAYNEAAANPDLRLLHQSGRPGRRAEEDRRSKRPSGQGGQDPRLRPQPSGLRHPGARGYRQEGRRTPRRPPGRGPGRRRPHPAGHGECARPGVLGRPR